MVGRHFNSGHTDLRTWPCPCLGLGVVALLMSLHAPALAITQTASATVTPTPTPTATATATACTPIGPPTLSVIMGVQPAHPVVGDQVVLTFSAFAPGGLPTYTLVGGSPVLAGNPPSDHHDRFDEAAQFTLAAAQAGIATVTLSVNFETPYGCTEAPFWQFVTLQPDPFAIVVADQPTGATQDEGGGCSLVPRAQASDASLLLVLPVAWLLRRKARARTACASR
jgi:hypothetical protein